MPIRALRCGPCLGLALLAGCVAPGVTPERIQALETDQLAFLRDGTTTREEVLLKLGGPGATFEGNRILTYDFVLDLKGVWHRVGAPAAGDWQYAPPGGFRIATTSLVLVFDAGGLLLKHNLVRDPPPPAPTPLPDPPSEKDPS